MAELKQVTRVLIGHKHTLGKREQEGSKPADRSTLKEKIPKPQQLMLLHVFEPVCFGVYQEEDNE